MLKNVWAVVDLPLEMARTVSDDVTVIPLTDADDIAEKIRSGKPSAVLELLLLIEARVYCVKVLRVEAVLCDAESIAEALIVHYLTLAEVFEGLFYIGVIDKANEVVVSDARLLLCGEILVEVGDHITLNSDILHIGWYACRRHGIDACGMVDKIRS